VKGGGEGKPGMGGTRGRWVETVGRVKENGGR